MLKNMTMTSRIAALALAGVAAASAGCGGSSTASDTAAQTTAAVAADSTIAVELGQGKELSIVPSTTTAKAGAVTFTVHNAGAMMHEMVVVPLPAGGVAALKTKDGTADESTAVGEAPDIEAGASKTVTLTLKPGKYVLLCNLPGHFAGGMWATIVSVS